METGEAFRRLVEIMARLRAPGGCPWDREQTSESIVPYTIEETYEVVEAIDSKDPKAVCDELGDLLLQVVFHAQFAAEKKQFDVTDVIRAISDKLVRRHPHVFSEKEEDRLQNAAQVLEKWAVIKEKEGRKNLLDGIPKAMPALLRAARIGEKAASVGFDWEDAAGVERKVAEELEEFRTASPATKEEELGDLLFALSNLARHLKLDAESALRKATEKFERRFRAMEAESAAAGKKLKGLSPAELDALWNRAKAKR